MPTSPPDSRNAVRRPRVDLVPPYAYSIGPEAIELARRAGVTPDDWQAESITHMLGIAEDGRWACQEYCEWIPRQNGKGTLLEIRVLAGLFLLGEMEIMWTAHLYNTSIKAFKRLKRLIKNLGEQVGDNENLIDVDGILVKIKNTNGEEGFQRLDTDAELQFLSRSKGGGRGFTGDLLIVDEAFAYNEEHQEALEPSLSARSLEIPGPQVLYTSTPPLSTEPDKIMFRLKQRAESGDRDGLGYRDWGAAGTLENLETVNLADRALWKATNPALGKRISESFVARELGKMGERGFARERLCIWPEPPADEGGVIDFEQWKDLVDPDSQAGDDITFAVDITPKRDWAAIASFGLRPDGLGHVELVDHRPGTDWVVARLVELKARWEPVAIALDAKGPAGSLLIELEDVGIARPKTGEDGKRVEPRRGDLIIPTANEVAAGCGQIADAVKQAKVRHIDQIPLNSAVGGVATRPLGDAYAWARKTSTADISPLVAATLARWAYYSRINAIQDHQPPPATAPAAPPSNTDLWRPRQRLSL